MLNGSQTNAQNSSIATQGRWDGKETQRTHVFLNEKEADEGESVVSTDEAYTCSITLP